MWICIFRSWFFVQNVYTCCVCAYVCYTYGIWWVMNIMKNSTHRIVSSRSEKTHMNLSFEIWQSHIKRCCIAFLAMNLSVHMLLRHFSNSLSSEMHALIHLNVCKEIYNVKNYSPNNTKYNTISLESFVLRVISFSYLLIYLDLLCSSLFRRICWNLFRNLFAKLHDAIQMRIAFLES